MDYFSLNFGSISNVPNRTWGDLCISRHAVPLSARPNNMTRQQKVETLEIVYQLGKSIAVNHQLATTPGRWGRGWFTNWLLDAAYQISCAHNPSPRVVSLLWRKKRNEACVSMWIDVSWFLNIYDDLHSIMYYDVLWCIMYDVYLTCSSRLVPFLRHWHRADRPGAWLLGKVF